MQKRFARAAGLKLCLAAGCSKMGLICFQIVNCCAGSIVEVAHAVVLSFWMLLPLGRSQRPVFQWVILCGLTHFACSHWGMCAMCASKCRGRAPGPPCCHYHWADVQHHFCVGMWYALHVGSSMAMSYFRFLAKKGASRSLVDARIQNACVTPLHFLLLDGLRRWGFHLFPTSIQLDGCHPNIPGFAMTLTWPWATLVKGLNGQSSQLTSTPLRRTTTASTGMQMPF